MGRGRFQNRSGATPADRSGEVVGGCYESAGGVRGDQDRPKITPTPPKTAEDRPKTAQDHPKTAQDRPRPTQNRPKTASRPLQDLLKRSKAARERAKTAPRPPQEYPETVFVIENGFEEHSKLETQVC